MDAPQIPNNTQSEVRIFLPRFLQITGQIFPLCIARNATEGIESGRICSAVRWGSVGGKGLTAGGFQSIYHRVCCYMRDTGSWPDWICRDKDIKKVGIMEFRDSWKQNEMRGTGSKAE